MLVNCSAFGCADTLYSASLSNCIRARALASKSGKNSSAYVYPVDPSYEYTHAAIMNAYL